jgi:hypothetical protein|nr:MAG TPA: hypothetical protein [Caudoviricetes sp.]
MVAKIDRTGEENVNNFGSEMVIVECRKNNDIDVYFPEYDWTFKNATYQSFKNSLIKCPYEKRVYGVGYLGEGKYKSKENGKITRVYKTWQHMLERCYDEKYQKRQPTYKDCTVCEEWHNFQNFAEWYYNNYYKIEGQQMNLDKDILIKGNKVYSPETCIFVSQTINKLFIKRDGKRGDSVIGTSPVNGKYKVYCRLINPKTGKSKQEYLGYYDTQEKAFEIYKYYKEKNIKQVADYYKGQIPTILYNALYNYEVEITD